MGLPKIDVPVYTITLPFSKAKIKYRPFTVKEEKLLLFSQTEEDPKQIASSIKQVVQNCIMNDVDMTDLPAFEVDYLFLKLRAVSVNNVVKMKLKDENSDEYNDVELNLDEVELIVKEQVPDKIEINAQYNMKLRYPSFKNIESVVEILGEGSSRGDFTIGLIGESIESIYSKDGEEVYKFSDYSKQERQEFLESLTSKNFQDIQKFLANAPVLEHTLEYFDRDGNPRTRVLRGLFDFFMFA